MKHSRQFLLLFAFSCLCCACSDDSGNGSSGTESCQCNEGQVCAQNGICYSDEACLNCGVQQVCVGGQCYDNGTECAKCTAEQICKNDACFDKDDPCASCGENQICKNDACFDKDDPCASCGENQICQDHACVDINDPCAKCSSEQVCKHDVCYDKDDPCAACDEEQSCISGKCISAGDDSCGSDCVAPNYCEGDVCKTCENACDSECCSDGQSCDAILMSCMTACESGSAPCGGDCCEDAQECDFNYGCVPVCTEGESTRCESSEGVACCDDATQECLNGACVSKCSGTRCGETQELCCDGDTPVCEENVCKITCGGTRCGDSDEFCCDNTEEICLYKQCLKRGNTCESASDCSYDEFCEESSKTCVKVDADPNACVVMPKKGEFKPVLQWYWPNDLPDGKPSTYPGYVGVNDTPIAINLTDDNDDGKIDENDIPDVVFSTQGSESGGYYKLPGVIRVISGDDGHEIASSEVLYYPAENLAAGDIDNDGLAEIIATRINQSPNTVDILNVVVDSESPTGYSLKVKASVETSYSYIAIGGHTDSSLADLDGDGFAEIITHNGIIERNSEGKYDWRCKRDMGDHPIPVDLDGDGVPELVGYGIYDNHCNVLVEETGTSREYWAVADLIPDSEDAAQTGELIPEVVRTRYTSQAPGLVEVWKLFKDKEGKWSKSIVRTAEIPINAARAKSELNLDCSATPTVYNCLAGGGPPVIADFNGDKRPDIGFASRWYYIVFSNEGDSLKILWADANIHDYSSAATGSSVFDFEGDGLAEVVYADEYNLHIYSGLGSNTDADNDSYPDSKTILEIPNSNGTLTEYPIIVDVDNDGSTEIVVAATRYSGAKEQYSGVRAFEDPNGQWVRTRRIWNQHNYYVTNVNEDGSIPKNAEVNWLHPKLNNFRQNVQPDGVYNAPNLVAMDLTSDQADCKNGILKLTAKAENKGSLGIKAGLSVKFYAVVKIDGKETNVLIGESKIPTVMAPGATGTATLDWDQTVMVDGKKIEIKSPVKIFFVLDEPTESKEFGEFIECIEDDNTLGAQDIELCPTQVS